MYIVSKWRDYYDKIKAFGIDKTVVYKRETFEIPKKRSHNHVYWHERDDFPSICEKHNQKSKYVFSYSVIGFCGSLHPVVQARRYDLKTDVLLNKTNFYSYSELSSFLDARNLKDSGRGFWRHTEIRIESSDGLKRFFDSCTWIKFSDKFREHNVPVFEYTSMKTDPGFLNEGLRLNPNLEHYDFGKVKDAVTAFQDIYMFLSGVLGTPERPMVKLSDKDLAKKHGHGDKYSFRTPPKKRKK